MASAPAAVDSAGRRRMASNLLLCLAPSGVAEALTVAALPIRLAQPLPPMHHSALYVRRKICPSEMAGDAQVASSPAELVPRISSSGEGLTMNISPDWLGMKSFPSARTGEDHEPLSAPCPVRRFSASLFPFV